MPKYFINFDSDGKIKGRYIDDIHGDSIPDDAVETEQEIFEKTISETDGIWKLSADGSINKYPIIYTLVETKAMQANLIRIGFESALYGGLNTTLNIKLVCTMESIQRLKGLYDFSVFMGDTKLAILDFDGVEHANISLGDVAKLLKECITYYRAADQTKESKLAQIAAASTPEAVAAVVW